jgi:hypothetical protein
MIEARQTLPRNKYREDNYQGGVDLEASADRAELVLIQWYFSSGPCWYAFDFSGRLAGVVDIEEHRDSHLHMPSPP